MGLVERLRDTDLNTDILEQAAVEITRLKRVNQTLTERNLFLVAALKKVRDDLNRTVFEVLEED